MELPRAQRRRMKNCRGCSSQPDGVCREMSFLLACELRARNQTLTGRNCQFILGEQVHTVCRIHRDRCVSCGVVLDTGRIDHSVITLKKLKEWPLTDNDCEHDHMDQRIAFLLYDVNPRHCPDCGVIPFFKMVYLTAKQKEEILSQREAANSDETFPYAASMGLGVIGTTLSQPMPRMIDRLRDFEKTKNTESSYNTQPFHVNISFFAAETREKAHKLMERNWRDEDIVNTAPDATASSIGTSRHSFTSGVGGWATWSFQDALKYSIYDDPDGCVEQLRNLGKDLSGMAQCILEFNRRGRLTNEEVKESMQLFGEAVMPQLA